ncbi:adenosine receptor A2a [Nematostella vectensis]|uniref:adenosine receptor A2a n=1 Tax=Nematostella vectensis TaxID=45351 RepID=UPI002077137F|nr:adenosine receptor A2a [Nematostella vectensis]
MIYPLPMTIVLAVLGGLITIENLFVCSLVLRYKQLRSHTNGFVFSLALADLAYGSLVIPVHLAIPPKLLHNYLLALVLMANISTLLAVTLDRFVAVRHLLLYTTFMRKYFWVIVGVSWAFPIAASLLPLIWDSDATHFAHEIYIYCILAVGILLPYLLILAAYIAIFHTVRRHARFLTQFPVTADNKEAHEEGRRVCAEARVARIFAVVAAIFVISWLPVVYMTFVGNMDRLDLIPRWLTTVSWLTLSVGSLVNAPIYAFMKRDFRDVISKFALSTRAIVSRKREEKEAEMEIGTFHVTVVAEE